MFLPVLFLFFLCLCLFSFPQLSKTHRDGLIDPIAKGSPSPGLGSISVSIIYC